MACPLSCYCGLMCRCGCDPPPDPPPRTLGPPGAQSCSSHTVYILLLGAAESGKSTIMRQMKIIHSGGMSPVSLRSYTRHVLQNALTCVTRLIKAVEEAAVPWGSPEAAHAAHTLSALTPSSWGLLEDDVDPAVIPQDHAHLMKVLWEDTAAQECWKRANEFNLPDNTEYYLSATDRLAQQPYLPTQEDVLQLRIPTRAATVYDFTDRDWTFRITDVGGQRGERRKWLRLFDSINAIIFLTALSEYDQTWSEEEEDGMNRLELSLQLFCETLKYRGFIDTSIILFLNKVDVLQKKIATSDLSRYFPEYTGPRGDHRNAIDFIRNKFMGHAKDRKDFFTHETCATDTKTTKFVFAAVRESILWDNIRKFMDPFHLT
ncbi:guanine nucleotide-binding protein subunit alpha-11-like [Penaeus chinensis]|uniref:guanine nucleotide-binding protein subunit alpha-11-like n=1 Tax=Penaeus chinensis TaxID=139456 RepID=UPI001FB6C298|nr:guanine nucleotide-binding protein subunit alpha-11-like [Penaeus chinensis]